MSTAGVKVEGAARLRRELRRAGDDLDDMTAAHRTVAQIVAAIAQASTPRRSGALAATVRGSGTKTRASVRAGYKRTPYAGIIHYGTPPGYARHYQPQPWIQLAATQGEPRWVRHYQQAVDKALAKVRGAA